MEGCVCLCLCVSKCGICVGEAHTCHNTHVDVRGKLLGTGIPCPSFPNMVSLCLLLCNFSAASG